MRHASHDDAGPLRGFLGPKKAGRTPKKTVTMRKPGKTPITFERGGLHRSLNVPEGQPIPSGKKRAALAGEYGRKAKQQANFGFRGALAKGRRTAAE